LSRAIEREAIFHPESRSNLRHWVETVLRDPLAGIGKPEPLKYLLAGAWSRRITQEHRLVYRVGGNRIDFLQARYHY
jgi:toxin YoeB